MLFLCQTWLKMCDDSAKCNVGWCASGGFCYCGLSSKPAIITVAIVSLLATAADAIFDDGCACYCDARDQVKALRLVLRALFQVANLLLIIASLLENASLIQIYIWYTMGFLALGFGVAIADTLLCWRLTNRRRRKWCVVNFVSEVVFLFVLSRCLPLVNMYRNNLLDSKLGASSL